MAQQPGDQLKLGDIFLARGVGAVAGVAHEVQSRYGKALFVDRVVKKGRVLHHAGHTDHGVVTALGLLLQIVQGIAPGQDHHLVPVGKLIVQCAPKIEVL